jgi:hypothetical protein
MTKVKELIEQMERIIAMKSVDDVFNDKCVVSVYIKGVVSEAKTELERLEAENVRLTQFGKWAFNMSCEAIDLDGADIQEKLTEFGLIEERAVNPEENEYGANTLYFWKQPEGV